MTLRKKLEGNPYSLTQDELKTPHNGEYTVESFGAGIQVNPKAANNHYNLARALHSAGDLIAAIKNYKQAIKIKPDYIIAHDNLALSLKNSGDLDAAIKTYQDVLTIKPDYADAYYNMGMTQTEKGDLDASIDSYKQAIKIKPDFADAYYNMGIILKEKGDLDASIDSYKQAIKIKPDFALVYYDMGIALAEKNDPAASIESYKKAIEIKPGYADAYYNMGVTQTEKGDLDASIDSYKQAIKINPAHANAYYNMGVSLKDQGDLAASIDSYKQAVKIKPNFADAYYNMGVSLKDQGDLAASIDSYKQAIEIKPDFADAYYNMADALSGLAFQKPNPGLQKIIKSILDLKTCVRPMDIAAAAISLLKLEPSLHKYLQIHSIGELRKLLHEMITELSGLPLLLKLMGVCPIADLEIENLLKKVRSCLLLSISAFKNSPEVLRFQSALALQCFTNEYIYDQSESEIKALEVLNLKVVRTLSNGKQPSPKILLCLASYKALTEYEWYKKITATSEIVEVFTRQVTEPMQESHLKSTIPTLEEIIDKVSIKVREQYEKNPYPRWVNLGLPSKAASISKVVNTAKLRLFDNDICEVDAPDILIAGCGTGQHSIGTATRFKNSKVLAIDLSLSSLAYAKRKAQEIGVINIEYMQADILKLKKLHRQFDVIESAGVLHHMDEPTAGWRVLTDCLKPGGLMKIGLYSELARQDIVAMRKEISQSGIGSSDLEMKSFRTSVIGSDKDHHNRIVNSPDFYSLSSLRDLLFHAQEHRFTIPQLKYCLTELGLKFCGLENGQIVRKFRLTNAGSNDPYYLDKWQVYEENNPKTFAGMYEFWCQKVA